MDKTHKIAKNFHNNKMFFFFFYQCLIPLTNLLPSYRTGDKQEVNPKSFRE